MAIFMSRECSTQVTADVALKELAEWIGSMPRVNVETDAQYFEKQLEAHGAKDFLGAQVAEMYCLEDQMVSKWLAAMPPRELVIASLPVLFTLLGNDRFPTSSTGTDKSC